MLEPPEEGAPIRIHLVEFDVAHTRLSGWHEAARAMVAEVVRKVVGTGPLRLDYELAGHRLLVRSLDLGQPWQGIHEDLLALVEEVAGAVMPPGRECHADLGGRGF